MFRAIELRGRLPDAALDGRPAEWRLLVSLFGQQDSGEGDDDLERRGDFAEGAKRKGSAMSGDDTEVGSGPREPAPQERRRDLLKKALGLAGVIGVSTLSGAQGAMAEKRKCPPDWRFRQGESQSRRGNSDQGR